MKHFVLHNVRKHREIKIGEKYIALGISLKLGILDKIKITFSKPKGYMGISGKMLITSLGLNAIVRSKKDKTSRYSIAYFSIKDISNIVKYF